MKGSSSSARNQQRSAQRNYQLSSLVSISNVKSIVASMNGSAEGSGVAHNKTAEVFVVAPPVPNLSPSGSNKRKTSLEKEVVRAERKKHAAQKNSCEAPKSISAADNDSKAVEMLGTRNNTSMSTKSAAISIVNAANERRPEPASLDDNVGGDGGKCVVVHNGNVMTSESVNDSRSNKVDQRVKLKSAKKGHGHSPSSSSADSDNEDESEISSAEDSSDELETSSSNDSDHRRKGGSSGGLEPISEERSLRIDLPDVSRGEDDGDRNMARLVVDDDEDDANDDGNVTIVILKSILQITMNTTLTVVVGGRNVLATIECTCRRLVMENINFALLLTFVGGTNYLLHSWESVSEMANVILTMCSGGWMRVE